MAQSELVAWELEKKTGHKFKLKTFTTQGDLQTDKALWQLEGKDFFTKELDHALLKGEVDLVVHSYKDLGSERPIGIKLAAITERRYPFDILLMRKEVVKKLTNVQKLNIGTSSPRRITNTQSHLSSLLPVGEKTEVVTSTLRGNVNTRIKKLKEGQFDGIILAFAGLERLASNPNTKTELADLLNGLDFMVLPISVLPASASQGALAIECQNQRDDDGELEKALKSIEHPSTVEEVRLERKTFNSYGGGCHLAVGVTVKKLEEGLLEVVRGVHEGESIQSLHFHRNESLPKPPGEKFFIGMPQEKNASDSIFVFDKLITKTPIKNERSTAEIGSNLFFTSKYCLKELENNFTPNCFLWSAGVKGHQLLNRQGYWVHGSADSKGHEEIKNFKDSNLIKILTKDLNWKVLTHKESESGLGEIIPSYSREINPDFSSLENELREIRCFFWTSYPQFEIYRTKFPFIADSQNLHCCGLGNTYKKFQSQKVPVFPFFSINDYKGWILKRDT